MTQFITKGRQRHYHKWVVNSDTKELVCLHTRLSKGMCGTKKGETKYHADSTVYEGNVYHSKFEAHRAYELDLLLRAGKIKGWKRQVKLGIYGCFRCKQIFLDYAGCRCGEKQDRLFITNYYVDFSVQHHDGTTELEEVKGMVLPLWQLKWRLVELIFHGNENVKLTVIKS